MRKFFGLNADWETLSPSASFSPEEVEVVDHSNSSGMVMREIGIVLAGALGFAAVIDVVLMILNVRPFV